MTEETIRSALRDCYDPVIPCNIIDLGLIQSIAVETDLQAPGRGIPGVPERHIVSLSLIPTSPGEETEAQISAQIANRLAGLEEVSSTRITVLHTPLWTPQNITPAGRKTLGLDGNPTLVQIR